MTNKQLQLLSKIKCKKTYLRESEMCSGNAYRVTLTYKGKKCSFTFHDNYYNKSSKKDFLYCLCLDANSYEFNSDISDFVREFGYNDIRKAWKAYDGCKRQYERLHKLFDAKEIEILNTLEQ